MTEHSTPVKQEAERHGSRQNSLNLLCPLSGTGHPSEHRKRVEHIFELWW
jgi:hypothetical protein